MDINISFLDISLLLLPHKLGGALDYIYKTIKDQVQKITIVETRY